MEKKVEKPKRKSKGQVARENRGYIQDRRTKMVYLVDKSTMKREKK